MLILLGLKGNKVQGNKEGSIPFPGTYSKRLSAAFFIPHVLHVHFLFRQIRPQYTGSPEDVPIRLNRHNQGYVTEIGISR
jgi:hypothetical protein